MIIKENFLLYCSLFYVYSLFTIYILFIYLFIYFSFIYLFTYSVESKESRNVRDFSNSTKNTYVHEGDQREGYSHFQEKWSTFVILRFYFPLFCFIQLFFSSHYLTNHWQISFFAIYLYSLQFQIKNKISFLFWFLYLFQI